MSTETSGRMSYLRKGSKNLEHGIPTVMYYFEPMKWFAPSAILTGIAMRMPPIDWVSYFTGALWSALCLLSAWHCYQCYRAQVILLHTIRVVGLHHSRERRLWLTIGKLREAVKAHASRCAEKGIEPAYAILGEPDAEDFYTRLIYREDIAEAVLDDAERAGVIISGEPDWVGRHQRG